MSMNTPASPETTPIGTVLIDRTEISSRIAELAGEIDAAYASLESPLILLSVLKGSILFLADLARSLTVPVELEFIAVRSYEGTQSTGSVELVKDVSMPLRDRDVLMIEDIVDTGTTIAFLHEHIRRHAPRSVRLASLLNKESRREKSVTVDYVGFDIPDRFVIGYGLDYDGIYRNLPDIRVLDTDGD